MASDREQDTPKVLIIGASGFVGASIALAAASRHDLVPVACMRHPNNALAAAGVEQRTCDATDSAALTRAPPAATCTPAPGWDSPLPPGWTIRSPGALPLAPILIGEGARALFDVNRWRR